MATTKYNESAHTLTFKDIVSQKTYIITLDPALNNKDFNFYQSLTDDELRLIIPRMKNVDWYRSSDIFFPELQVSYNMCTKIVSYFENCAQVLIYNVEYSEILNCKCLEKLVISKQAV